MNGQLNVNVFAGEWTSEWSVDGMNVIVLHRFCSTQVENWTVLSYCDAYILWQEYVKDKREREREDRNKESVWKIAFNFSLTGVNGSKEHEQQATNSELPNIT